MNLIAGRCKYFVTSTTGFKKKKTYFQSLDISPAAARAASLGGIALDSWLLQLSPTAKHGAKIEKLDLV